MTVDEVIYLRLEGAVLLPEGTLRLILRHHASMAGIGVGELLMRVVTRKVDIPAVHELVHGGLHRVPRLAERTIRRASSLHSTGASGLKGLHCSSVGRVPRVVQIVAKDHSVDHGLAGMVRLPEWAHNFLTATSASIPFELAHVGLVWVVAAVVNVASQNDVVDRTMSTQDVLLAGFSVEKLHMAEITLHGGREHVAWGVRCPNLRSRCLPKC
mmetsp:Transcript_68090/g.142216  ORF Transcript_68090/g.142216 Transcript_68090/m.142216 type:complete len:213 (-) Transcript_68090:44-682(-)